MNTETERPHYLMKIGYKKPCTGVRIQDKKTNPNFKIVYLDEKGNEGDIGGVSK